MLRVCRPIDRDRRALKAAEFIEGMKAQLKCSSSRQLRFFSIVYVRAGDCLYARRVSVCKRGESVCVRAAGVCV